MRWALATRRAGGLAALAVSLACCAELATAGQAPQFKGRSLADALSILQQGGLQIVFSSHVVTAEMRVLSEPRGTSPREQLDQMLRPHGLKAEPGPGSIIQVVPADPRDGADAVPALPETTTIRGEVLEAETLAPLAGALVRVTGGDQALSDTRGRFRLRVGDASPQTLGVSIDGYEPARRRIDVSGGARHSITLVLRRAHSGYSEHVTVTGRPEDRGVGSEATLDAEGLRSTRDVLADDALQVAHALPRVAALDDFRSEFSVRGSPYRHIGVVVDGVATSWLRHSVYGRSNLGSMSMLASDIVEGMTLEAGAYPQLYEDRIGAQLGLTLREGSRDSRQFHASLSGTSAALVAEGPLGTRRRGSWVASVRNSYLDWPVNQRANSGRAFSFADAHAKLVYDVSPAQQLSITLLGGRSRLDGADELLPDALANGTNQAILVSVGWRTAIGSATAIRQRASIVGQAFSSTGQIGQSAAGGSDQALSYRGDVLRSLAGGSFEAGGEFSRMRGQRQPLPGGAETSIEPALPATGAPEAFGAVWFTRAAYAHFDRTILGRVQFGAGLRVADSTLVGGLTVSRWILGRWRVGPGWTVNASSGVSHQFPDLPAVRGPLGSADLEAERATHIDVGVERQLGSLRWQATVFHRVESGVLREPDARPRLVDGVVTSLFDPGRYENALEGTSRGVELVLSRDGPGRLTGWISYAYGKTQQTDPITHETFWADLDRRHAFNAVGIYHVSEVTSVGLVFRGSTNVPIPAYLAVRDGGLYAGERPNAVRLPSYARLDVRAQRTLGFRAPRITLFAEVLNVLNSTNQGPADGVVHTSTGQAVGFTRTLMPRRASAGIVVHF